MQWRGRTVTPGPAIGLVSRGVPANFFPCDQSGLSDPFGQQVHLQHAAGSPNPGRLSRRFPPKAKVMPGTEPICR